MKREDLEAREFGLIIASSNFQFYAAPEADAVMDAMEDRIKELEETIFRMEASTPKWINAKDRLPKEDDEVLFTCGHDEIFIGEYWAGNSEIYWYSKDGHRILDVTHWMPLPSTSTIKGN